LKIIKPYHEIIDEPAKDFVIYYLEKTARVCYKSESKIKENSATPLLRSLFKNGHHSIFEHVSFSTRIICDRGISHELVRHRHCTFSQESTRYANYSKHKFNREITVIKPFFFSEGSDSYILWYNSMKFSEQAYLSLIEKGASPQEARSVLPNSLKTELIMTANLREYLHILTLRCSPKAHPQMREIMIPLLENIYEFAPFMFKDLYNIYKRKDSTKKEI